MFELGKGLQNKDKDASEQRLNFQFNSGAVTGVSAIIPLAVIGCSQTLVAVSSAASGLSGTPILGLQLQRFVVGAGLTTIPLNGSSLLTILATSTSGIQAHAIPAANTSLLQQGDWLQAVSSGATSAATYNISVVLQVLQAVRTDYGV